MNEVRGHGVTDGYAVFIDEKQVRKIYILVKSGNSHCVPPEA